MTIFHLDHHGDDYRIEIHDDRFVMLLQHDDGNWNVAAEMTLRAAEVLATLDLESCASASWQTRSRDHLAQAHAIDNSSPL